MTVAYQIYSSTLTASSTAQQTLLIARKGRIICLDFNTMFVGGGGGGGYQTVAVTKNSNGGSVVGINSPQREALVGNITAAYGTAAYVAPCKSVPGLAIPVEAGDTLTLSTGQAGTAPATGIGAVTIYVEE